MISDSSLLAYLKTCHNVVNCQRLRKFQTSSGFYLFLIRIALILHKQCCFISQKLGLRLMKQTCNYTLQPPLNISVTNVNHFLHWINFMLLLPPPRMVSPYLHTRQICHMQLCDRLQAMLGLLTLHCTQYKHLHIQCIHKTAVYCSYFKSFFIITVELYCTMK